MDSNESKTLNKRLITTLKNNCGMQEATTLPSNTSTYRRGTSQLDYVLCSSTIQHYIRFICLQDYGTICSSDHKSYILDIDIKHWVCSNSDALKQDRTRQITSLSYKKIAKYKKK